jgi:hypothetical protein
MRLRTLFSDGEGPRSRAVRGIVGVSGIAEHAHNLDAIYVELLPPLWLLLKWQVDGSDECLPGGLVAEHRVEHLASAFERVVRVACAEG